MAKAYFTFCYNGVPPPQYHDERTNVECDGMHRYAFAVGTEKPEVAFAELSREPLFRRLLGPVLFGWHDADRLIISSKPDMAPAILDVDPLACLYVKTSSGGIYKLLIRELERQCISALKFGLNCEGCPRFNALLPGDCYLRNIALHAADLRWRPKLFVPPDSVPADDFEPAELDKFILRGVKNGYALSNGYRYVPPRIAREDLAIPKRGYGKIGYLRYYDTFLLDVVEVDRNREEASARAQSAAQTRKNEQRCKRECIFAPCQKFHGKSYRSWVTSCWDDATPGPFTREMVERSYRAWMKTFTRMRTPEEIALIAFNAGEITHAFGYELTLCGMDRDLNTVEFMGARGSFSRHFSFEDAVEIMRTPWNRGGRDYARMRVRRDPPEMSEEDLWIYAELRRRDYMPGYATKFGWAEPRVMHVSWSGSSFTVTCHCGWDRRVGSIEEVVNLFGVSNTLHNHPAKTLAMVEEGCLESNPDTQP